MTIHCRNHCGACGLHFVSVDAFDLHRTGSFPKGTRRCLDPARVSRRGGMVVVEEAGVCGMYGTKEKGVTVWGTQP